MSHILAQDAYLERRDRMAIAPVRDTRTEAEKRFPCPETFDVLNHWTFFANEYHCQTTVDGRQTQMSMKVSDPAEPTSVFYVTFDFEVGEWQCYCPSFRQHFAQTMIWAVQLRIEENKRARTQGAN